MLVLLYEYLTSGGTFSETTGLPTTALLEEGAAMVRSVAQDLLKIADVQVLLLRDARLDDLDDCKQLDCRLERISSAAQERGALERHGASADYTLLIAPELEHRLLERCRWAQQAGARLLSPPADFIALASDKHLLACRLASAGLPVPQAVLIEPGAPLPDNFPFPAVIKPIDGAGSLFVQQLKCSTQSYQLPEWPVPMRLERYCPGVPISVSVLAGPASCVLLPPSQQLLSGDGSFQYLGGELPLEESLAKRAHRLASAVVAALPPALGYFGIDMVLGSAEDGSEDVVIEVNPRLTTSYIGLRQFLTNNLAQAMIDVAEGRAIELATSGKPVRFTH